MFCEQCGKKISDNAKFCKYCGYGMGEEDIEEKVIEEEFTEEKAELKKQSKIKLPKKEKIVKEPAVKKGNKKGRLKKLIIKVLITVLVLLAVFFGVKSYMTSRTVAQIPDPEYYFGMAADEDDNNNRVRQIIIRSENDFKDAAEAYVDVLESGNYPFEVRSDIHEDDGDFKYSLAYTGGKKLWGHTLYEVSVSYYVPNDNFTSMDNHAVYITIYHCNNFELVEAEQFEWPEESIEDNAAPDRFEGIDFNNIVGGSEEAPPEENIVEEETVQQVVEEEPQIVEPEVTEPQVPALALPDLYAFIGGQGRQMNQSSQEGEVGEEYGYKMEIDDGWKAANEYVELLANDPRFKLSMRPRAEEDSDTILYLHTERYYFDYVGDEDITPATGRYHQGEYKYFTADVSVSIARNGKDEYTSIVIWHSSDFNVTDLGDRASVVPEGASGSGSSSPSFNSSTQPARKPCPHCDDGDCDKCGGDGYLHSLASDKEDRNCPALYCNNGRCTYCDGDGWY